MHNYFRKPQFVNVYFIIVCSSRVPSLLPKIGDFQRLYITYILVRT